MPGNLPFGAGINIERLDTVVPVTYLYACTSDKIHKSLAGIVSVRNRSLRWWTRNPRGGVDNSCVNSDGVAL